MNASVYELLALAMRYWFIAILGVIVFLLIQSLVREWRIERAVQRRIASAPSALFLLLVSSEDKRLRPGLAFPLDGDTLLGSGRGCDLRLKTRTLKKRHLVLHLEETQVTVIPEGGAFAAVDGQQITRRSALLPHQRLQAGGLIFELVQTDAQEELA